MKFRLKILKVSLFVLLVLTGVYIFHYAETGRNTIGGVEAENTVEDVNVAEKVVAIDSGHGGIDPGKIGVGGIYEKDVNLAISVKLKKLLEQSGITVIMTRSDDNGLYNESDTNKKASDMKKRCSIINESNADAVVSIHQNSYVSGESRGAQVFYYKQSAEGKKLAGILTEMSTQIDYINYVTVGIGINANTKKFPEELKDHATSLYLECGHMVKRASVIASIMKCFEEDYRLFLETEDLSGLMETYMSMLVNRDRDVLVLDPSGTYKAKALGIDKNGELIVRREDGTSEHVYAGEVSVRGVYGYV